MVETVLRPHGEFIVRAQDASAGATAKPDVRTVPAAMQTAARPVRTIPARTVVLRSSSRPAPAPSSRCPGYPTGPVGNPQSPTRDHNLEHKLAFGLAEVADVSYCQGQHHNHAVSQGHHERPQGGGRMNSERRSGDAGNDPADVLTRPGRSPDLVLRYGDGPDQVADVHLPPAGRAGGAGTGERAPFERAPSERAPLTIFLHGGFWRAEYGREHTRPLAEALAAAGLRCLRAGVPSDRTAGRRLAWDVRRCGCGGRHIAGPGRRGDWRPGGGGCLAGPASRSFGWRASCPLGG